MEHQRYQLMLNNEKKHWWYVGRQQLLTNLIHDQFSGKKLKILDVGCGTGSTMLTLQQFGKVHGIDISPQAIKFCKYRGLTEIRRVKNNRFPYKDNTFDVITCLDVLEHIKDDDRTLIEIKRVLKPKGYLIIFVPAYPILWSELDFRSHHYRRYTKESLRRLLKKTHFDIIRVKYFNHLLFLPILLIKLIQKMPFLKNRDWGADPITPVFFINKILLFVFYFDIFTLKFYNPPFGVSIYLLAQKK